MTQREPERLTEQEWRTLEEFRRDWMKFCDADPVDPDFTERMEDAGLIELVAVDDEALEGLFASERGIERGGQMWVATPLGRAKLSSGGDE